MNIAALTTVSSPYIIARYSVFATNFSGCRLSLIEFGRVSTIYDWKSSELTSPYQRIILFEEPSETQPVYRLAISLLSELNKLQPDAVIIAGYANLAMLSALLWSFWQQKPAILLSATKEDDTPRSRWKEGLKSWILQGFKAVLVGGQPHKRYLEKLGVAADSIFMGYNVVGNEVFHSSAINSLARPLRKPYFLSINRFVPKKNLLFMISAYAEYRKVVGSHAWDLVLCGDGELRPQIEQTIFDLGLEGTIHLPGFLQQDELLPYFAHASCFIHTSIQEQWGLVVNEAMAAGLPILVSNRCGCFEDLVLEGINGFGFDPENSQQLIYLMVKMSSGEVDLKAMGDAALKHIQKFSPDYFAQGLTQAIEYALAHR